MPRAVDEEEDEEVESQLWEEWVKLFLVFECTSQVEDGSVPPRVFHYHSPSLEAVLGHSSGSVV